VPSCQFQLAAFEIGKIDNIESRLMRRLHDDRRRADRWLQRSNRASSGLSLVENHVSRIDRMPRIPPWGTGMLPPSTTQESSYADLVAPASLLVLDAANLYRDIVQKLEEGVDYPGQKAPVESDHCGAGSVIRSASPSLT
jgi:hypothetical protein